MPENPFQVSGIVSGNSELRAIDEGISETRDDRPGHDAALIMARLWPGVRKQDKGPIDRLFGQIFDQQARIIPEYTDIPETIVANIAEQLDHAVHVRLTADQIYSGVVPRLPGKMFAAAKANFQPYFARFRPGSAKQCRRRYTIEHRLRCDFDGRQQILDKRTLPRTKRAATAPAIENPAAV